MMNTFPARPLPLGLLLGALVACHSGSSSGSNPGAGTTGAPTADVHFPLTRGVTDQPLIRVRGTAADTDGIAAIEVNGMIADTVDGFAHWQADVALAPGLNDIVVSTRDALGNANPSAVRLDIRFVGPFLADVRAIDALPGDQAVVWDESLGALLAIEFVNGSRRFLSGPTVGSGPQLTEVRAIAANAAGTTVYCATPTTLFAVDVTSGDRTPISGSGVGSGPPLIAVRGLALDAAPGIAWLTQGGPSVGALLAVDLASGAREIVSGGLSVGTGAPLIVPWGLDLEPRTAAATRAVIADPIGRRVVSADLTSGDRTMISGEEFPDTVGLGPEFVTPIDVVLALGRTYVLDEGAAAIFAVEPGTGNRSEFSSAAAGSGPALSGPRAMVLDEVNQRLLVALADRVVSVDLVSGERKSIADSSNGSGVGFGRLRSLDGHLRTNKLVVHSDRTSGTPPGFRLTSVDLASGNRTPLISDDSISGATILELKGFVCQRLLDRGYGIGRVIVGAEERLALFGMLFATGEITPLLVYDAAFDPPQADVQLNDRNQYILASVGNRIDRYIFASDTHSTFSGDGAGSGVPMVAPGRLVWDQPTRGLIVADPGQASLLMVDTLTGERSRISGPAVGAGPELIAPGGVAIDFIPRRSIVCDGGEARRLVQVDLQTGDREVIFDLRADPTFPDVEPLDAQWDGERQIVYVLLGDGLRALLAFDPYSRQRLVIAQ